MKNRWHFLARCLIVPLLLFPVSGFSWQRVPLERQVQEQAGPLFSEKRDWRIRRIVFVGETRIRKSTVLKILDLREGEVLPGTSIEELRERLEFRSRKDDYLYDIKAVFRPEPPFLDMDITVKEKWTFFPIPAVSYSDERWSFGLGFVEMNFLGSKNQLGGAFLYKDEYLSFSGALNIDSLLLEDLGVLAAFFSAKKKKYFYGSGYEVVESYKETGSGYVVNFRYKASPFRFWLRHTLVDRDYGEASGARPLPSPGLESFLDFSVILRDWTNLEGYESGYQLRLSLGKDAAFLGSDFRRTIFNWSISVALNIMFDHNLLFSHSGVVSAGFPEQLYLEIGNSTSGWNPAILGYRGGQYGARHFVFNRLEYRVPFATSRYMNFAVVGFSEHMLFSADPDFGSPKYIYNLGLSFRVYLRRLFIPAVVLYAVYAEDNREFDFGVTLGVSL